MFPSAYSSPHSKEASSAPVTTPIIAPFTIPFKVNLMVERITSDLNTALASAKSAALISFAPKILFFIELHQTPLSAVAGPPTERGTMCDQSLPLWNFHTASGPAARTGAGTLSQSPLAAGKLLY